MLFIDINNGERMSLRSLAIEYDTLKYEDPWNHEKNFKTELLNIIMATINGRNDLEIVGMTCAETSRYIQRLRSAL